MISARESLRVLLALSVLAVGCGATPAKPNGTPNPALPALGPGGTLGIDVRKLAARPRLALVAREGDPSPALVVAFATEAAPALNAALAGAIEARLKQLGVEVAVHVDRDAFRVVSLAQTPEKLEALFRALVAATTKPIVAGAPELRVARERLEALRRHPLDAPELVPIASCTGGLGAIASELVLDPSSAAGARELEQTRAQSLVVARASIGAVGTSAFCDAVAAALERSSGWIEGTPPIDPWPTSDVVGAYAMPALERSPPRLSLAVRVPDAQAATAAAARLGGPRSRFLAKLAAASEPWRVTEVSGVARPSGGCVALTLEATDRATVSVEQDAARVVATARAEITAELAEGGGPSHATRLVLAAGDAREAAARAAWWALSTPAAQSPAWSVALGFAGQPATDKDRFRTAIEGFLAKVGKPVAERRVALERGQGELWLLLASPCGTSEETGEDAGRTALGALAIAESRRGATEVVLEPWITSDGIGLLAHAGLRDERETRAELARRVGDELGRAMSGTVLSPEALSAARSVGLDFLERSYGRQAAVFEVLGADVAPDHPSWLEPVGTFPRVASAGLEPVRERWQQLANGPLRLAILGNGETSDAAQAADAVERWLGPRFVDRACRVAPASAPRPGRYEAHLVREAPLVQALIGAPVPSAATPGHDLAEIAVSLLEGPNGALARTATSASTQSVRLLGGARVSILLLDLRAPEDALASSINEAKLALSKLASISDSDFALAAATSTARAAAARGEARGRVSDLWSSRAPGPTAPTPAAFRDFVAQWLKDSALITVEGRPARVP